jgi:hypothetical protein
MPCKRTIQLRRILGHSYGFTARGLKKERSLMTVFMTRFIEYRIRRIKPNDLAGC